MLKYTISVARQRSGDDGVSREPSHNCSGNASLEAAREIAIRATDLELGGRRALVTDELLDLRFIFEHWRNR